MPLGVTLVTWLALTVTVQTCAAGRAGLGVSVNEDPLPGSVGLAVNVSGVPVGHAMLNALAVALTASLKFTTIPAVGVTFMAPLAGVVEVTDGGGAVVNVNTSLLPIGTPTLAEVTWAATTVTVHVVAVGRFVSGVRVKLDAPPGGAGLSVKATFVPDGHCRVKEVLVTLTA